MNNDEINRKLAGLQGFVFAPAEMGHYGKMTYAKWRHASGREYVSESPPPYATDWQWCGPLVELHCIETYYCGPKKWEAFFRTEGGSRPHVPYSDSHYAETPQRAICLAVITTHEFTT